MQNKKNIEKKGVIERFLFEERNILILVSLLLLIHGLIHLIGFVVYWQIIEGFEDLKYKTTLLFGILDVGDVGIRIFGIIWLFTAVGYIFITMNLIAGRYNKIRESLAIVTIISLIITLLDFTVAYAGALFNILILLGIFFAYKKKLVIKSKVRNNG